MTAAFEADGTLTIVHNERSISLHPFLSAYGVRLRMSGVQPSEAGATLIAPTGHELAVTMTPIDHGLRIVFHGKHQDTQIGLRMPLAPGGPWYGMGERTVQGWPLESAGAISRPFITYDNASDGTLNIGTPLWIGGAGIALLVEEDTGELHAELDADPAGDLTLTQFAPPIPNGATILGDYDAPEPRLVLRVVLAADITQAARSALRILGHPTAAPPLALLAEPIWTTWARYKTAIDQRQTIEFAQEIVERGFPRSVLEIDDRWQTAYGDLEFDREKFPDPRAMVEQLHGLGFRVTLWVPPFFDPRGQAFAEAAEAGYLVRHPATGQPYLTRWWQGWGGLIDVSNRAALDWWGANLRRLQTEYGIDGFKFDGAEGNFLPVEALTATPMAPAEYSDRYVSFVAAGWQWTEVRTGWRSQQHGLLFREWDKWSRWGLDNGLRAVITQAMTMGLIGYPFVLPDMIGGNAYAGELPDRELLIRWTQATAFLPAMQFSIPPWDYDDEAVAICLEHARLHAGLAPYLDELCAAAIADGTPLVRPLWWAHPRDETTYAIDDQWMLGERWLVAPVVQPGATSRDIYLPDGAWRAVDGAEFAGPLWLRGYAAPLAALPRFERLC